MWQLLFAVLWLIPTMSFGANVYIDRTLTANCTTGNYSVINRTCAGQDGNAYQDIQSALNASAERRHNQYPCRHLRLQCGRRRDRA